MLYGGSFVLIVAGLRAASSFLIPMMLAGFFGIICTPLLALLQRWMRFSIALFVLVIILAGVFAAISVFVGSSLRQIIAELPDLQRQLRTLETQVLEWLQQWDLGTPAEEFVGAFDPSAFTSFLGVFLNSLLRTLSDGILVMLLVAFILAENAWFQTKLATIDKGSGQITRPVEQIINNVHRYMSIKTIISLATGAVIWLGLLVLGIDHAALWGFLAFLLNYIPNVGSILAGIPPIVLALIQHGFGSALLVTLLFCAVNQIIGSVLEPRMQGKGLGLSPLVVFISLLFWGWVFGAVGMLLSAPITMALKIACQEFPETRWVAILLSGDSELRADPTVP